MKEWKDRPIEIANNLNPDFCGELIYSAIKEYEKQTSRGLPFSLLFLILPIVLHKATRDKITTSRTHMSVWLHKEPQVKINFSQRANNLIEITLESYRFLYKCKIISINKNSKISTVNKLKRSKHNKPEAEIKECINKAKIVSRWFARNDDIETIYAMWGVKP